MKMMKMKKRRRRKRLLENLILKRFQPLSLKSKKIYEMTGEITCISLNILCSQLAYLMTMKLKRNFIQYLNIISRTAIVNNNKNQLAYFHISLKHIQITIFDRNVITFLKISLTASSLSRDLVVLISAKKQLERFLKTTLKHIFWRAICFLVKTNA